MDVCGNKLKLVKELVERTWNGVVEVCGEDWSRFEMDNAKNQLDYLRLFDKSF